MTNNIKLPGSTDPDFSKAVADYLKRFSCVIHLDKRKLDKQEMYKWCADHLGEKYKDWFIYEGGTQDKVWALQIVSPKKATFFRLKYNEMIVRSFDKTIL
jgi:hypothetical protein